MLHMPLARVAIYLHSIYFLSQFFCLVFLYALRAPHLAGARSRRAPSKASKMDRNSLQNMETGMRVGIIPQDRPRPVANGSRTNILELI